MTLLAALVAVLLGACDGSPSDPPPAGGSASRQPDARSVVEPDPSQQRPAEVSWSRRLDVIGQPVDAGPRVLVVLARTAGRVELVGLDRASGRTTFSVPFHPGGTPSGVALSPKVTATDAGRVLAIVRRTAGGPLQAVDVRTGDVVRSTPVAIDDYDACSDGTDVCWSGYDSGPNEFGYPTGGGPMRWDLETGRVRENDGQEAARIVGTPDLYVRGEGRTATIMRLTGGQRTRWSQSVSLTVAPGADPSHGWSFSHDEKSDVYVGALGRPVAPALVRAFHAGKRVEIDYAKRYLTVAIDGRTGEKLWSRRGANPWCPLLRSTDDLDARTLCVVDGTNVQQEGRKPRDKDLSVDLHGIDPRSGDTAWTFELTGKDATRAYGGATPLAPYGLVLPSPEGPVALDMRTGERQLVDADTVLLCPAGPDRITVYGVDRSAGELYGACTPDGKKAAGVPSAFGASGVAGEGGVRFVSMPGRVVAFSS